MHLLTRLRSPLLSKPIHRKNWGGCAAVGWCHARGFALPPTKSKIRARASLTLPDEDSFPTVKWNLRTLVPRELSASDYLDLSDSRALPLTKIVDLDWPPLITYGTRERGGYTPFPVNTRGFFYHRWHPHHPLGGSIRFRVVQTAHKERFSEGQDLLNEYGTPWEIPILAVAHLERYKSLQPFVYQRHSKVFTPERLKAYTDVLGFARRNYIDAQSQVISSLNTPFYVDLTHPRRDCKIYLFREGGVHVLPMQRNFMRPPSGPKMSREEAVRWYNQNWPYTSGRLLCKLQSRVDRTGVTLFSIRVLRIIEPVRWEHPHPENIKLPDFPLQPGRMVTMNGFAAEEPGYLWEGGMGWSEASLQTRRAVTEQARDTSSDEAQPAAPAA